MSTQRHCVLLVPQDGETLALCSCGWQQQCTAHGEAFRVAQSHYQFFFWSEHDR